MNLIVPISLPNKDNEHTVKTIHIYNRYIRLQKSSIYRKVGTTYIEISMGIFQHCLFIILVAHGAEKPLYIFFFTTDVRAEATVSDVTDRPSRLQHHGQQPLSRVTDKAPPDWLPGNTTKSRDQWER